ncbi:MAG: dihydrofolate reductase [Rikenellaceae bacterium]
MKKLILSTLAMTTLLTGCGQKPAAETASGEFQWQVDTFDDINVLRYKVNGFEELSLAQKEMIYYLSQAAVTGRDILFDQNFKYNLPLRKTLEAIYTTYSGDKTAPEFKSFEKYLKKVWFASGVHHHYSEDKFSPEFSADYFEGLLAATPADKLPCAEMLETIKKVIFDADFFPKRLNQATDEDLVLTSGVNFYEGVTQAEVEEFYAKMADPNDNTPISYGLNSKVIKVDGVVTEDVWKIGGTYGAALSETVKWLEKAAAVAENDHQKSVINALIKHYNTGSLVDYDEFNVLWAKENDGLIDFVNGFTETYTDPFGRKATWESLVNFKDIEATKRTTIISGNAQWFEDNSPIDDEFQKTEVKGVSAKVITAAMLGGDCYPATPIGINLPNSDWIRRDHGSKSVTIANITEAYENASNGSGFTEEFIIDKNEVEKKAKYAALANDIHTDLHECLGHASGVLAPGVKGDELKVHSSSLEEARADLFALYYITDPKMIELGVVESVEVGRTEYYSYILNGMMTQLTRIAPGKDIEQAHMRNRALVANWAYELGKADNVIEKISKDGKSYIKINDYDKLRDIFALQLREIQRIKSTGDYDTGAKLIETYAVKIDQKLHKEILDRYAALGIAPYSGFVNPTYTLVEKDGKVVDVTVDYTQGYTEQMLDYSTNYSFL